MRLITCSRPSFFTRLCLLALAGGLCVSCATAAPAPTLTPLPVPAFTLAPPTASPTAMPTSTPASIWGSFAAPQFTPSTPIPPPAAPLQRPPRLRTLLLMGTDQESPFTGRTDAMVLLFYSNLSRRAAMLALPADLFVYIPGFTMQRLQTAYAAGGFEMVASALQYNFGIQPDAFALLHPAEFSRFTTELGGLTVYVEQDAPDFCGGITRGAQQMTSEKIDCYLRFRDGLSGELDRNARQLNILRGVFQRMVRGGNLARLPALYQQYAPFIETSLSLADLEALIPTALNLGDQEQLLLLTYAPTALDVWTPAGQSLTSVLVPRPNVLPVPVQQAIEWVQAAEPTSEIVGTFVYELTVSPTPTPTPTRTYTPTRTASRTRTTTLTPSVTLNPTPEPATASPSPSPTETSGT